MIDIVLLAVGLLLLFLGGEGLLRGSDALANKMGISPLVIGLTIVAAGTSAPELIVCVAAALEDKPGIALGNVVGSNIANVMLIIGAAGVIMPMTATRRLVLRDGMVMLAASVLVLILALTGTVERWQGIVMVGLLIAFLVYAYWTEKYGNAPSGELHASEGEQLEDLPKSTGVAVVMLLAGLGMLLGGAHLLVESATELARALGVSETVIGLSIVALGTSVPELATSVIAALRGQADIAIGNVLGSNLFNTLGILGTTAAVAPVPIDPRVMQVDIWVMVGVAALMLVFMVTGWKICRREAGLLLGGYGAYVGFLFW